MTIAKLSVSIDQQLLAFLEGYQKKYNIKAKSEVVSEALRLLRERELDSQYAAAMEEWQQESELWEVVTGDGLLGEQR